jgi:hypothetical protein
MANRLPACLVALAPVRRPKSDAQTAASAVGHLFHLVWRDATPFTNWDRIPMFRKSTYEALSGSSEGKKAEYRVASAHR